MYSDSWKNYIQRVPESPDVLFGSGLIVSDAKATTKFRTKRSVLDITLTTHAHKTYDDPYFAGLMLRDLTTSLPLLSWQRDLNPIPFEALQYTVPVNPSHNYELVLYGHEVTFDFSDAYFLNKLQLTEHSLPDAGSTAALLGLGLAGIGAVRRKLA